MVYLLPLGTSDMTIKYIVILLHKNRKFGWNGGPRFGTLLYYFPAIFKTRWILF